MNGGLNIFPEALSELSLPIDGLSPMAQEIIQAIADTYQCNRDFVVAAMFSAAGTAAGKKVQVYDGRYRNSMALYTCIVAPSGSNKTTPVKEILRPLTERNNANYLIYKEALKEWRKEIKQGNEDAEKPIFRQLIIGDCTPEARYKVLQENPNGVLLYSDEIATFLGNMNRYAKSGEIPQLISIWSGDGVTINRKGDEPTVIDAPFLSIIGGVQPSVLQETFGSDYFRNSGMNQRWLFVFPDPTPPPMYSEVTLSTQLREIWCNYATQLIDAYPNDISTLIIDNEAKATYTAYYNELQRKKATSNDYMAAVYAKLQVIAERWAGITHLLGEHHGMTRILPNEMEYTVRCMRYFESTAEKVYNLLSSPMIQAKPMGKEELIAKAWEEWKCKDRAISKQSFADVVGVSRQAVSKAIEKNAYRLRGCGCGVAETPMDRALGEDEAATSPTVIGEGTGMAE